MSLTQMVPAAAGEVPGFFQLGVKVVIKETGDAQSIVFAVPQDLAVPFSYRPGQFLTLRVVVDGEPQLRCYSLASAPDVDSDLKVTVKRVPGGRVSNWLLDHIQAGDVLTVMPPKGIFCLRDGDAPVVLFGAGSGITPVIAILKQVLASTTRTVKLVYANRDPRSIIFRQELAELSARYGARFTLVHRLDSGEGPLTVWAVGGYVDNPAAEFYLCGPGPFMRTVKEGLRVAGIDDRQVFMESFTAEADDAADAVDAAAPVDGQEARVTVRYHGQEHLITARPNEMIHAAAARQGLNLPFSCKAGYCGLCMARVVSGKVRLKENLGALSDAQIAEGLTLACQAQVESAEVTVVFE